MEGPRQESQDADGTVVSALVGLPDDVLGTNAQSAATSLPAPGCAQHGNPTIATTVAAGCSPSTYHPACASGTSTGDNSTRAWFCHDLIATNDTPVGSPASDDDCLRPSRGGNQGCPLATLLNVGPYHECLSEVQREKPTMNMVCQADDLTANDAGDRLYDNFDYKREKAEEWWHTSNLTKVK